jgi:hypothetical protein
VAPGEKTLAVRSERSRASGEVEEQAGRGSGDLRLRFATAAHARLGFVGIVWTLVAFNLRGRISPGGAASTFPA